MVKYPSISAFSLLGVLLVGLPAFAWSAPPPPPPIVNPGAPAAPDVPPPFVNNADSLPDEPTGLPTPTPALSPEVDLQALQNSDVPAPTISDEEQIKNAMDMAMALYRAEDYDACARGADAILRRFPGKKLYWVLYLRGLCLEHREHYRQALDCYQQTLKEGPRTTYAEAAAFRVGLCQMKSGQTLEAEYTLRDIIENNPYSHYRLQAYVHLGDLYRNDRDWRSAERVYRDLVRFYPQSMWAWTSMFYIAEVAAHEGEDSAAIRVYQKLLGEQGAPKTLKAQAMLRIGDLYLSDQRWLDALQTYRYALRDFSDVPGVVQTCNLKIADATQGRRDNRVPYRFVEMPSVVTDQPVDEDYLLKQETLPGK